MKKLTKRQVEVVDFVRSFTRLSGYPPTRSEIAMFFGWASDNAAEEHLKACAKKGVIFLKRGVARGISLADESAK